jgi:uncharacterized protein (TIGR02452 family)
MSIKSVCTSYFNGFSAIGKADATPKEKLKAKICIASCFLLGLPPLILGIGLGISKAADGMKKLSNKFEYHTNMHPNSRIGKIGIKFFKVTTLLPDVTIHRDDLFVDVLNAGGYWINKHKATFSPAGAPVKYTRTHTESLDDSLTALKAKYGINTSPQKQIAPPQIQTADVTTEQAINNSTHYPIALVFANAEAPGGAPGLYKDTSGKFVYFGKGSRAQEESTCLRSNYFPSVTQLPQTLHTSIRDPKDKWNEYTTPFESRTEAYVSDNHLFGTQDPSGNFHQSSYLQQPKRVAFVASAAENYQGKLNIDCSEHSVVYADTRQRIETHLLAAADKAAAVKAQNPSQQVELIAGAFGCGVFAPQGNTNEYRRIVASIYKQLIPQFSGFFDVVTFAVPTLGRMPDPNKPEMRDPSVANHVIFKNVMNMRS